MVNTKSLLSNYTEFMLSRYIKLGDGNCVFAYGKGTMTIRSGDTDHIIDDVWYVPHINFNILSVSALTEQRYTVTFTDQYCTVTDVNCNPVMSTIQQCKLYSVEVLHDRRQRGHVQCVPYQPALNITKAESKDPKLWHARLGHVAKSTLSYMLDYDTVTGLPPLSELKSVYSHPCESCLSGAHTASPHPESKDRSEYPLQLVFADVTSPFLPSDTNFKYCLNIIDSYSGYAMSIPIKSKDIVAEALLQGLDQLAMLARKPVIELRTDQGAEFHNSALFEGLASRKIRLSHSTPYSHQQVGCVENYNRVVGIITRSLLHYSHRKHTLWPHAMKHACYLYNRRASRRVNLKKTHYELFTGEKPDLQHLRIWGCKCYSRVTSELQGSKLEPRTEVGMFVGYDDFSKSYKIRIGRTVVNRAEVVFDESALGDSTDTDFHDNALPSSTPPSHAPLPPPPAQRKHARTYTPTSGAQHVKSHKRLSVSSAGTPAAQATVAEAFTTASEEQLLAGRSDEQAPVAEAYTDVSGEQLLSSDKYLHDHPIAVVDQSLAIDPICVDNRNVNPIDHALAAVDPISSTENRNVTPIVEPVTSNRNVPDPIHPFPVKVVGQELPIPSSYQEAVTCKYAHHWKKAIKSELDSLQEMNVFTVTDIPVGRKPLSSKWVFSWKTDDAGIVQKAKARLVVRGFEQQPGIDYNELFSPTVSQHTIRLLLAHSVELGLHMHQIDFKTAFLNGDLEEVIYLQLPEGAASDSDSHSHKVWLLNKSLYGLKQAPRQWNKKLHEGLSKLGFIQSSYDPALYYRIESDSSKSYLLVHVDDMLIANQTEAIVLQIKSELGSLFNITDLGKLHNYLKLQVDRQPDGSVYLHQSTYAKEIVSKYLDLSVAKVLASTPFTPGLILTQIDSVHSTDPVQHTPCTKPYASLVGSLMYLANSTRPDLMHAVSCLCRYLANPSEAHWLAAQHVLSYINSSHNLGIKYSKIDLELVGYCDSNHMTCVDTRRSVTGYLFTKCGGAVSWQSKLQPTVAWSTAEAEYMAAGAAGKEALWLSRLAAEMSALGLENPITVSSGYSEQGVRLVPTGGKKNPLTAQVIRCDNQSALHLIHNNQCSSETKHIDKVHHWIRSYVSSGDLAYTFISGKENPADILTKPLPKPAFIKFRDMLGLVPVESSH